MDTETISGYVDHIIYRNAENGYTVLVLVSEGEEVTCVGTLPLLSDGEMIEAHGRMTSHASYGEQFRIESYVEKAPEDVLSIERYLSSGAIKGIGATMAGRIVRRFKEDTFRIIEREPERLAEIKGISERKAREIAAQINDKREMRDVMLFLSQYGISGALAVKLFQRYGTAIYTIIRENPYKLADEVTGIGFRTADEIAQRAGILADSGFRISSGLLYTLSMAQGEGHVYLPKNLLLQRTLRMLNIEMSDHVETQLMNLVVDRKIVMRREEEEERAYLSSLYRMELDTARLLTERNIRAELQKEKTLEQIRRIEQKMDTQLDEKQRQAVLTAAGNGVMILTGGPGTGKTMTINTMIAYFESEGMKVALAAPTGRAAKRITEATGHDAKTIHRLLEVEGDPESGSTGFQRGEDNPLEEDVVIIDEMSMVDIFLMHALLQAAAIGTILVLVGDANQLPSVGPGSVLSDMIDSGTLPVVRLTKIFRQAEESDIVMNAHRIHAGEHPVLDNKSKDFFFMQRSDADQIIANTIRLVQTRLPAYVGVSPSDIQVLTPTRKGLTGVERLNRILQKYLNPVDAAKQECAHGEEEVFREGDKVMQIRNDYQIEWTVRGRYGAAVDSGTGVFNGDIGVIRSINSYLKEVTVEFDDLRSVVYNFNQLDELELAYAVTIHKSQGSEYPAVVIPLMDGPRMLMNRNLLYTAVTRAKNCVMIVGEADTFYRMIDNASTQHRFSALSYRLKEAASLGERV